MKTRMKPRAIETIVTLALALSENGTGAGAGGGLKVNAGNGLAPHRPIGLKKFIINGGEVWAINYKNAIRKAKKKQP